MSGKGGALGYSNVCIDCIRNIGNVSTFFANCLEHGDFKFSAIILFLCIRKLLRWYDLHNN